MMNSKTTVKAELKSEISSYSRPVTEVVALDIWCKCLGDGVGVRD